MAESFYERKFQIPGWAKKIIPVLVSILILYYYFHGQNWAELFSAASRANILLATIAIIIPQLTVWLSNALLTSWTLNWFFGPFSFRKFFWVRGAIFMLQMINNPLGAGGSLIYIQHKTKIEWSRLLGIMGFRFQLMIWAFCVIMIPITLFMHIHGHHENVGFNIWGWWIVLVFQIVFLIGTWNFWHNNSDLTRLGKVIVRNRENQFWKAFQLSTPKQWFKIMGIGLLEISIIFIGYYIVALAFDVRIPFGECLVVLPVVLFISNLPIAFGGFGTTTAAWIAFFGDYGSQENLIALTIFIPFARAIFRSLIGFISLKPALDELGTLSFFSPIAKVEEPPVATTS